MPLNPAYGLSHTGVNSANGVLLVVQVPNRTAGGSHRSTLLPGCRPFSLYHDTVERIRLSNPWSQMLTACLQAISAFDSVVADAHGMSSCDLGSMKQTF